jgi:hypothetical protein
VVAAAAQAQRACDLINPGEHQAIRGATHHPEVATVAGPRDTDGHRDSRVTRAIDHRRGPAGPTERTADWDAEAG